MSRLHSCEFVPRFMLAYHTISDGTLPCTTTSRSSPHELCTSKQSPGSGSVLFKLGIIRQLARGSRRKGPHRISTREVCFNAVHQTALSCAFELAASERH
ncbi:hypothetical protein MRB53_037350 [Persea americana]|nr:hypothetical protein MRB53_037350 [Persea americana]